MNLEKARKLIIKIRHRMCKFGSHPEDFHICIGDLEAVIEAFAEPDEGEKNIETLIEELSPNGKKALSEIIIKCRQPDQLQFGDFIKHKDYGQAFVIEPKDDSVGVLTGVGGRVVYRTWEIRGNNMKKIVGRRHTTLHHIENNLTGA